MDIDKYTAENHSWYFSAADLEFENSIQSNFDHNFLRLEDFINSFVFGTICLVGLPLNSLLIYVFFRFPKMQTVTNLYIMNLSATNVCFLISIVVFIVTDQSGNWPYGNLLCKMYHILSHIANITHSLFLLVLAVERYLTVCHPAIVRQWSKSLVTKHLATILWIVSFPLMFPVIMYSGTLDFGENNQHCIMDWPDSSIMTGETQYILYSFMNGFGFPFPIALVLCILIIRRWVKDGTQNRNSLQNEQLESTKLVLAILLVHFACVFPLFAMEFGLIFDREFGFSQSQIFFVIHQLSFCLGYSSAATTPILCAFLSTNFRKSFKKACFCAESQVGMHSEPDVAELQLISGIETCQ